MAEGQRRSALVDYFDDAGLARPTALADWDGEPEGRGFTYKIGNRLVQANNDLLGNITGIPGQFKENWRMLSDPTQRKMLARALIDDSALNNERRKAIFSILLWGSLLIWGVVGLILAIVNREALGTFQSGYALFFYSIATSLFLPTPFEIILGNAVENIGVFATVAIAAVAKVIGAWLVLMMGDKASEGLMAFISKRPKLQVRWDKLVAWAQKYGYAVVFVLFAIPFMSDTAPLFLLAVLHMKKALFLAITFVAIVIRSLLFIYAGDLFSSLF